MNVVVYDKSNFNKLMYKVSDFWPKVVDPNKWFFSQANANNEVTKSQIETFLRNETALSDMQIGIVLNPNGRLVQ